MKVAYENYNILGDSIVDSNLFRNLRMVRIFGLLVLLVTLSGCGFIETTILGSSTTAAAGSSYSTYKSVTMAKTGIDTGLALSGQKTTTDMIISSVTGKDCDIIRKIKNKEIEFVCKEITTHPPIGKR
tara:strand:- start:24775 stop:25158 length:384 start_codon:yes stop_codon:yes gene_type:complete